MEQHQQRQKRENIQHAVDHGLGDAGHYRGGNGHAGVPHGLLCFLHQGAPHILIQPQQGQQRLDLKFRFSFRHLRRLLLYGRVYLLLDAVLNERCGQPGQRTRKGGGDHARANQCHDRDHQSRQRLQQAPLDAENSKAY